MPNPYPIVFLTNGLGTVMIATAGITGNYPMSAGGWAPAIAARRASPLQGMGPYEDVDETLTISIVGTSALHAYQNLASITRVIEAAIPYADGDVMPPTLLHVLPQGATAGTTWTQAYRAVVLGRSAGDTTVGMTLPATYTEDAGLTYTIPDMQIQLRRRGQWLSATVETKTSVGATAVIAASVAMATSSPTAAPTTVTMTVPQTLTGGILPASFLVVGDWPSGSVDQYYRLLDVETTFTIIDSTGGGYTTGNNAIVGTAGALYDGIIAKGATGTITMTQPNITYSGYLGQLIAVFAAVRVIGTASSFGITPYVIQGGGTSWGVETVVAGSDGTVPRIVGLGQIMRPDAASATYYQAGARFVNYVTGGSLEVDYLAWVALTTPGTALNTSVIALARTPIGDASAGTAPHIIAAPFASGSVSDGNPNLVRDAPVIYASTSADGSVYSRTITYTGNAYVATQGSVYAAWMATSGGTAWRPLTTAGSLATATYRISRPSAHLIPE